MANVDRTIIVTIYSGAENIVKIIFTANNTVYAQEKFTV